MRKLLTALALVSAVVAGAAGCASSGRSRTETTVTGLNDLRKDGDEGKRSIKATVDALTALEKAEGRGLSASYEKFVEQFGTLETLASRARDHGQAMRDRGSEYFRSWEEQIGTMTNPDIKRRSEERRTALETLYTAMTTTMASCRQQYDKFSADLTDIKQALDLDLTPNGVKNLAEPIEKARTDADALDESIDDVLAKLEGLAKELNSIQGAGEGPKTEGAAAEGSKT
jgi:chromosome segregation ATPase